MSVEDRARMHRCRIEETEDPSCPQGSAPFTPVGRLIDCDTEGTATYISAFLENAHVVRYVRLRVGRNAGRPPQTGIPL